MAFCSIYTIGDIAVFYIPITLILSFFSVLPRSGWQLSGVVVSIALWTSVSNGVRNFEMLSVHDTTVSRTIRALHETLEPGSVFYSDSGMSTFEYAGEMAWDYFRFVELSENPVRLEITPDRLDDMEVFYTFESDLARLATGRPLDVRPVTPPLSFSAVWNRYADDFVVLLAVRGRISPDVSSALERVTATQENRAGGVGDESSYAAAFAGGRLVALEVSGRAKVRTALRIPGLDRTVTVVSQGACCGPAPAVGLVYYGTEQLSVNGAGLNVVVLDPDDGSLVSRYSFVEPVQNEASFPPLILEVRRR